MSIRQTQHPPQLSNVHPMPTIFLRIFLIYNLVSTFLLSLARKSLRPLLLPSSGFPANLLRTLVYQTSQITETENLVVSGNKDQLVQGLSVGPLPRPPPPREKLVRMDRNELRRMFQMFDKNGDGRITKQELTESLESLGIFIPDKELLSMIQRIDVNSDGCVDIDEFGELYQSIMESRDSEEEEDMKEAFNVFDQNGDGFITVDELRSVLSALGLKQGRAIDDCKTMIMKVDVDGDGRVNYNEFKQMMKGGGFNALSSN